MIIPIVSVLPNQNHLISWNEPEMRVENIFLVELEFLQIAQRAGFQRDARDRAHGFGRFGRLCGKTAKNKEEIAGSEKWSNTW